MPLDLPLGLSAEIEAAASRIDARGLETPLLPAPALSAVIGRAVFLKAEFLQPTGSFKVRGALNALEAHADAARIVGVVTFSTGNHGRALAWAAALAGVPCTVFVSELTPVFKRAALFDAGATVRISGACQSEAEQLARAYAAATGAVLVPPFDDIRVIAGQATVMREIAAQCPDVGTVVVPISGGGLGAGVASVARSLTPQVRLIGVTMERGAAMHASLAAGRPVEVREEPTLADSLGGDVGGPDSLTFPIIRDGFDDVLLVDEDAIAGAMIFAQRREKVLLEGAGAASIALALDPRSASFPEPIVLVATGGNVDPGVIDQLEARAVSPAR